jgi:hypothetical protein
VDVRKIGIQVRTKNSMPGAGANVLCTVGTYVVPYGRLSSRNDILFFSARSPLGLIGMKQTPEEKYYKGPRPCVN